MLLGGYFAFALVAVLSTFVAFQYGPASFSGWVYGICALVFGSLALIILMREDTIKITATVGDSWLERINRSVAQPISASK
jgi:hypothetical protein